MSNNENPNDQMTKSRTINLQNETREIQNELTGNHQANIGAVCRHSTQL